MSLVAGKLARGVRTDVLTSNKARKNLGPYLQEWRLSFNEMNSDFLIKIFFVIVF